MLMYFQIIVQILFCRFVNNSCQLLRSNLDLLERKLVKIYETPADLIGQFGALKILPIHIEINDRIKFCLVVVSYKEDKENSNEGFFTFAFVDSQKPANIFF
jgi:hypothetical protein